MGYKTISKQFEVPLFYSKEEYSRQLPILPGVDIPPNSTQGQTVQCSEKLQKTHELHLRPQLA